MDDPAAANANASHINRTMGVPVDPLIAAVVESMRKVYDPEIPINIYDLGLIYDIILDAENKAEVKMTEVAHAAR